jgi:F1F0 ATPase subunit 2
MMYVVAALAGILFGIIYFGGLWLTIQKMSQVNRPVILLIASFIVRLGLVLIGFYLIANGRIEMLAVSLITFFITRFFFISRIQPHTERSGRPHGHQP